MLEFASFILVDDDVRERRVRHGPSYVVTVLHAYDDEAFQSDFRMPKNVYKYIRDKISDDQY